MIYKVKSFGEGQNSTIWQGCFNQLQVNLMEKVVMPKHLKILTGVIITGVIFSGTMLFWKFKSVGVIPSQVMPNVFGIIISLGLIRGFYSRSKLAWQFAIGLSIFGLIGLFFLLFIFLKLTGGPSYQVILIVFLISATLEGYFLWVLFSKEVRHYFTWDNFNNIPGC